MEQRWRSRRIPLQVNRGQNRNASRGGEAQYATGILYHEGNAGQVKKSGASNVFRNVPFLPRLKCPVRGVGRHWRGGGVRRHFSPPPSVFWMKQAAREQGLMMGAKAARSDEYKKSGPPRKADPTGYSPANSVSARNGGQRRRNCSRRRRERRRVWWRRTPCSSRRLSRMARKPSFWRAGRSMATGSAPCAR